MAAMAVQHADAARPVAERDQILAEDAQRERQVGQAARTGTPAARRRRYSPQGVPGPDPGQLRIGRRHLAPSVAGIARG